jgi:hypothetical protein
MYGFWNRRIWMWVVTIPAIVFAAIAVMGDSAEVVLRIWWIAGPILLAIATVIWFALGPAKSKAEKATGKLAETPKFDSADLVMRLVMTPILTLLVLFAFALLFAVIMWLQPYWLIVGPVYGGFALLVIWTYLREAMAKRAAAKGAAPAKGDNLVS